MAAAARVPESLGGADMPDGTRAGAAAEGRAEGRAATPGIGGGLTIDPLSAHGGGGGRPDKETPGNEADSGGTMGPEPKPEAA